MTTANPYADLDLDYKKKKTEIDTLWQTERDEIINANWNVDLTPGEYNRYQNTLADVDDWHEESMLDLDEWYDTSKLDIDTYSEVTAAWEAGETENAIAGLSAFIDSHPDLDADTLTELNQQLAEWQGYTIVETDWDTLQAGIQESPPEWDIKLIDEFISAHPELSEENISILEGQKTEIQTGIDFGTAWDTLQTGVQEAGTDADSITLIDDFIASHPDLSPENVTVLEEQKTSIQEVSALNTGVQAAIEAGDSEGAISLIDTFLADHPDLTAETVAEYEQQKTDITDFAAINVAVEAGDYETAKSLIDTFIENRPDLSEERIAELQELKQSLRSLSEYTPQELNKFIDDLPDTPLAEMFPEGEVPADWFEAFGIPKTEVVGYQTLEAVAPPSQTYGPTTYMDYEVGPGETRQIPITEVVDWRAYLRKYSGLLTGVSDEITAQLESWGTQIESLMDKVPQYQSKDLDKWQESLSLVNQYIAQLNDSKLPVPNELKNLKERLEHELRPLSGSDKAVYGSKRARAAGFWNPESSPFGVFMDVLQGTEMGWGYILKGILGYSPILSKVLMPETFPTVPPWKWVPPSFEDYHADVPGPLQATATWTNPIYIMPIPGLAGIGPLAGRLGAATLGIPQIGRYLSPIALRGVLVLETAIAAPFMLGGAGFTKLSIAAQKKLMQMAQKESLISWYPDPAFVAKVGGAKKFAALPKSVQMRHILFNEISWPAHLRSIQSSSRTWFGRSLQKTPRWMQRPWEYVNPQLLGKSPEQMAALFERAPAIYGRQVAINGAAIQGSVGGSLKGIQRIFRAGLHETVGRSEQNAMKAFGFRRAGNPDDLICAKLVDHPQGLSKALGDVIEQKALWKKHISPEMYEMLEAYQAYHDTALRIAEVNGIEFPLKRKGVYFHRVCLGPSEIAEGKITPAIGKRLGTKTRLQHERIFSSQNEGIKAGYHYATPMEAADDVWAQITRAVSDKKTLAYWESTIKTIEKKVATRFPQEVAAKQHYDILWGGANRAEKALLRVGRGEKLTEATLASIERYNPEIGARLRALVLGTPELEARLAVGAKLNIGELKAIAQARGYTMRTVAADTRIAAQGYIFKFEKKGIKSLYAKSYKEASDLMRSFTPTEAIAAVPKAVPIPTRKATINNLLKQVQAHKAEIYPARLQASRDYTRAVQLAKRGTWEKVTLPMDVFPTLSGKLFPRDVAIALTKRFGDKPGLFLRAMVTAAQAMRMSKAALDLSAPFIQLMPIIGRHPLIWANAELRQMRVALQQSYYDRYLVQNFDAALELATHRGYLGSFEYFEFFPGMMKFLEKVPVVGKPLKFGFGQTYGRMESSFGFCGDYARIEMWKSLKPGIESRIGMKYAVKETGKAWQHLSESERKALLQAHSTEVSDRLFELATMLNKMTGVIDSSGLGIGITQRQIESAFIFFAPRYTRAGSALIADIFRGGMSGKMAIEALGTMAAGGSAFYSGVCFALGQTPNFDPTSAGFMTIRIGDRQFGTGGFHYSAIRLIGNIAAKIQDPEVTWVDMISLLKRDENGNIIWELNRWDNPFINFLFNRSSPLTSGTYLMAMENNEYFGEPLESLGDYVRFVGELFVPIWAESTFLEGYAPNWQTALGEFLGLRTFPVSPWKMRDEVRNQAALREYDRTWRNLMPSEQDQLREKYPEIVMWEDRARARWAIWDEANAETWDEWEADTERIWDTRIKALNLAGDEFINCLSTGGTGCGAVFRGKVSDAGNAYGVQMDDLELNPTYAPIYELFSEPIDPEITYAPKIALLEYYDLIYDNPALEDEYGNYQFDIRNQIEQAFIDKWRQPGEAEDECEIYDLVQQQLGYGKEYPIVYEELQKGRDILEPYRAIADNINANYEAMGYVLDSDAETQESLNAAIQWLQEQGRGEDANYYQSIVAGQIPNPAKATTDTQNQYAQQEYGMNWSSLIAPERDKLLGKYPAIQEARDADNRYNNIASDTVDIRKLTGRDVITVAEATKAAQNEWLKQNDDGDYYFQLFYTSTGLEGTEYQLPEWAE